MMEKPPPSSLPASSTTTEHETVTPTKLPPHRRLLSHIAKDVNTDSTGVTSALIFACFMTGFTSSVTFTACYIWCGFQTGGTIQLGLALARLFSNSGPYQPKSSRFEQPDRQALVSLLSFLLGTSVGRLGDRIGAKKRVWLVIGTMLQALCCMSAALCAWKSRESSFAINRIEPSWTSPLGLTALGFCSASLGIQGILGKRLNTAFGTAVVLTTIWCELINDPLLFARKAVKSRDHRVWAVFMLFVGAVCGRGLVNEIGSAGTLGIASGLRVLGAVGWLWVPEKR